MHSAEVMIVHTLQSNIVMSAVKFPIVESISREVGAVWTWSARCQVPAPSHPVRLTKATVWVDARGYVLHTESAID